MPFSNKPLYLQVRDALADLISSGAWKAGVQIPNEGELARESGVSPGTMRKALELLEAQGLVIRKQGRGTFVTNPGLDELVDRYVTLHGPDGERLRGQQIKVTEHGRYVADALECSWLRLRAGAEVYRIRRVRRHNGESFLLEDAVVPVELFPGLLDGKDISHEIGVLAQRHGILLGRAEERITMSVPPCDVAETLGALPGKAMVRLERITMMLDGRPAEWRIGYWHMDGSYYLANMK